MGPGEPERAEHWSLRTDHSSQARASGNGSKSVVPACFARHGEVVLEATGIGSRVAKMWNRAEMGVFVSNRTMPSGLFAAGEAVRKRSALGQRGRTSPLDSMCWGSQKDTVPATRVPVPQKVWVSFALDRS